MLGGELQGDKKIERQITYRSRKNQAVTLRPSVGECRHLPHGQV